MATSHDIRESNFPNLNKLIPRPPNPDMKTCVKKIQPRRSLAWLSVVLLSAALLLQFFTATATAQSTATVTTDKADYPPGATAYIIASGFQVGEPVEFQVLHADGSPSTGEDHQPWHVSDGSLDDLDGLVDGNIQTTWHVCEDDCVGETLELTATGLSSGSVAKTQFTDGNVRIRSFPSCVTFTLKVSIYTSTDCSGSLKSPPPANPKTITGVNSSSGDTTGVGNTESATFE